MISFAGVKSVIYRLFAFCVAASASGLMGLFGDFSFPAFAVSALLSAFYGFPTWLVTLYVAHRRKLAGWLFFTIAGTVAGFIGVTAAGLVDYRSGQDFWQNMSGNYTGLLPFALPGGTLAGFVYWLIAVRSTRVPD